MTKVLRKAIMKHSELETKYVRSKAMKNLKLIKSKETFAVNFIKMKEKECYEKLDLNKFTENKEFWKTIKPFQSNKV